MAMYKMNKILQRMEEKREKEVNVSDRSSGSPVSEETSANVEIAQELACSRELKNKHYSSSGLFA